MTPDQARLILYRLDKQDELLGEIHQEVKATNGKVRDLQLWRATIEGGRKALSWVQPLAVAVCSGLVVGVVVAVLT